MTAPYLREVLKIIEENEQGEGCSVELIDQKMRLGASYIRGVLESMRRAELIKSLGTRAVYLTNKGIEVLRGVK